ncbi:DNA-binding protein [Mycobacterium avium subsp. hominissuis 10-4249]|nr:DNA-binding protein [Mycobacterium avium subsp. hominissuis 10-4249]KDO94878.1 hypothetical protein MAVA5_15425 [Mycobacterium avium subsp. hominissuis A5]
MLAHWTHRTSGTPASVGAHRRGLSIPALLLTSAHALVDANTAWSPYTAVQVTSRTIRQMIADGRLTGYRSGARLIRVDLNEIDAAMTPFGGTM